MEQKSLTKLTHSSFGMGTVASGSFDQVIERVKSAFKDQGFGTLTVINMQATLQHKLAEEIEPYTILGMCNPELASRALKAEHEVGLLLPCNVLVHECGGTVHVAAQDPMMLMDLSKNENLHPIAAEAKARVEHALEEIGSH